MGRIELRHSEFPVPLAKGPHISGPYVYGFDLIPKWRPTSVYIDWTAPSDKGE